MTTKDDDIYQYPADEYVVDEADKVESADAVAERDAQYEDDASDETKLTMASSLWHKLQDAWRQLPTRAKRVVILAGIILVLFILVLCISGHSSHHASKQPVAPKVKAVVPAAQPKLVQPQSIMQQQYAINTTKVSDLGRKLSSMQQAVSAAHVDNQQLAYKLDHTNTQLQDLAQQNAALQHDMIRLTDSVVALKQKVSRYNDFKRSMVKDKIQFVEHYNLVGMVSGRAWVMDQNGKTWTVKVGDSLKNFGIVDQINDEAGYVKSRHGKLIEYTVAS